MKDLLRSKLLPELTALLLICAFAVTFAASAAGTHAASEKFPAWGNLDCNDFSRGAPRIPGCSSFLMLAGF